ncbi:MULTISPECIES: LysR substrate-binding domain-containing protein [Paraburkholderia]|jgi:DNA-binding transcriptional LysR family regulator|uniref:LysR family transcriptional regulator n=1 Tax=Paraburkholderia largidicola TaxID=3014751 RepID=A0A7I8C1G6_9BURK|nr:MULTISPECIES: LysR substrate-binding domain-containing protein [Paraburkholderia]BEU27582.1 LysR substrate-binding domain-containing protein [Paraburkholderia sp. 22B1P]GJH34024.1 LysR family transcriptional regulator [Paraburkholderia hospita]CAG9271397.1 LysR family transcriptional regulator [Paraburkholderia caribensis]BCF94288.1 LysR family transcriptional regulator [Paraburkholderia sp. PGU16]GJH04263.1 LysR family transcriptional regulator [Paraburkholderia terrae]
MPTLRMLKTFKAVARTGSFSAAADKVALTQAAVSLQMRGLEEALGRQLFDRRGRQITLTQHGQSIWPKVEQILDLLAELEGKPTDAMEGPVTIGAVVSVIGALSLAVARLKAAHPRLDVRLLSARSDELANMVEVGEVDVAAVVARADETLPDTLKWTTLYTEPMMLIVSRDVADNDPQRILRSHGFLRFDRRVRTGQVVEQALEKAGLMVNEYLELNSIETIVALVREKVGVAVLPLLIRGNWLNDPLLRVIPIASPPTLRTVGMVQRASDDRKALMREIVDTLQAMPRERT